MAIDRRLAATVAAVVVGAVGIAALALTGVFRPRLPLVVKGVVLVENSDPRKQVPISGARMRAETSAGVFTAVTDVTGLFELTLPGRTKGETAKLTAEHDGYQPTDATARVGAEDPVIRMASSAVQSPLEQRADIAITNLRLRYSGKTTLTTDVGSLAATFEVANVGNVRCREERPCSPDGKWKAAEGVHSWDAGEGNDFRNVRASCIAGPCPFTTVESQNTSEDGRMLRVTVLDWSDTATFLVEAEVSRTREINVTRQSYPAIFGSAMSFTLPGTAEGPTIEAELNGNDIVFPMGPDLILSWANCSAGADRNGARLYRCELKAGYVFK